MVTTNNNILFVSKCTNHNRLGILCICNSKRIITLELISVVEYKIKKIQVRYIPYIYNIYDVFKLYKTRTKRLTKKTLILNPETNNSGFKEYFSPYLMYFRNGVTVPCLLSEWRDRLRCERKNNISQLKIFVIVIQNLEQYLKLRY